MSVISNRSSLKTLALRLAMSISLFTLATGLHSSSNQLSMSPAEFDNFMRNIPASEIEALTAELLQPAYIEPVHMTPEQIQAAIADLERFLNRLQSAYPVPMQRGSCVSPSRKP